MREQEGPQERTAAPVRGATSVEQAEGLAADRGGTRASAAHPRFPARPIKKPPLIKGGDRHHASDRDRQAETAERRLGAARAA